MGSTIDPVNSLEKNRESMGKEEREKEEPIKLPSTETEMPVKSNKPAALTTDDVKREEKNIMEGGTSSKDIRDNKKIQATARDSELHSAELNERTLRYTLDSLNNDLNEKKLAEKNVHKIYRVQKDRSNDSLEIG